MIYFIAALIFTAATLGVVYPFFRRKEQEKLEPEEEVRDAPVRRGAIYEAIQELEFDRAAGKVSQEDYERIRAAYEMEAAALLQEEERQGKARSRSLRKPAPAKATPDTAPTVSPRLGLLIPAAILLVVGLGLGFFLATSLQPRQPGMSITGDIGRGGDDVASTLNAANQALERGEFRQAFEGYRKILDKEPHNVGALTQLGVILAKAQHYDDAILAFDRALSLKPNDPKALFEKGLVLFQGKVQPREGVKVWEQLIKTASPENPYAVTARRLLDEVRQSMGRPSPRPPATPSPQ